MSAAAQRPVRPGTPRGPLRVACDAALIESGLCGALHQAFGRDTGIAVQIVPAPASALLGSLAAGEADVGLVNAPDAEITLEKQGLIHDRRPVASGEFVFVGPTRSPRRGSAPPHSFRDAAGFLAWLHPAATSQPEALVFLSAGDGSGVHLAEQAAWRRAGLAPQEPWYRTASPGSGLIAQARDTGAFALVERGAWSARGGAPLKVVVERDAALAEPVHAMRSFRSPHPAGRIFVAWIAGLRGHAVVARQRGYRVPAG